MRISIWKNKTKKNETYLTVSIEDDNGNKERVNCFLNKNKPTDKYPDFTGTNESRNNIDVEEEPF